MKTVGVLLIAIGVAAVLGQSPQPQQGGHGTSGPYSGVATRMYGTPTSDQCWGGTGSGQGWKLCGGGAIPSGMILFIATGSCPAGWTENAALAGYSVVVTTTAAGDIGAHGGSNSYTPAGSVSQPAFAGSAATLTGIVSQPTFTGASSQSTSAVSAGTPAGTNGTVSFTPLGTVAWPTGGGSVPVFTGSAGTVPAQTFTGSSVTSGATSAGTPAGTNSGAAFSVTTAAFTTGSGNYAAKAMGGTTLASGTTSITLSTQPTFAGSAMATHTHTVTAAGTNGTVSFTPAGIVAWPTPVPTFSGSVGTVPAQIFTGTALATHAHTLTPAGSVSQPTLAMNSYIPAGSVSQPSFSGTPATITPPYFKVIACQKN